MLTDENISYDTETFTEKLGLVTAWIQYKEADGSYRKVLTEINCKTAKIRSVRFLDYNKTGDFVSNNERASNWASFVPDTKGEQMYKIFCKDEPSYQKSQDYIDYAELVNKGNKLLPLKDYEQLISVGYQIIQDFQEYPAYSESGYYFLSIGKRGQGKLQEAKNFILKAINIEANDANFNILGQIYQAENNFPAAIDAFWKSLRKNEDGFFRGHYNLETIYNETKNYKGLTDLYKFLVAHGEITKYVELADTYEKQKLSALAKTTRIAGINALEMSIKIGEADELNYYALSQIYESTNNPNKAELTLKAAVTKFPDDGFTTSALASYYSNNKQWEKAVNFIKNALPRISDNYYKKSLLDDLKNAYEKLGRLKDAEQVDIELEKLK